MKDNTALACTLSWDTGCWNPATMVDPRTHRETSCHCSGQQHGWGSGSQSALTPRQACERGNLQHDCSPSPRDLSCGLTTATGETPSENHSTKHSPMRDSTMHLLLFYATTHRVVYGTAEIIQTLSKCPISGPLKMCVLFQTLFPFW